ncbi:MAG: TIR domain-containing protein [Opitutus sp.]|nr:TIR domain-containing protein [Opitutus sp.]
MSDSLHKAVFISYAREDSEAARRIADALRAFGVEVWFDQNELRGGDTWDAKIKQQIRECALFVPVISQHTQERTEGYSRREWKLGVERTHDMASSRAFLAPIVIDETTEARAEVPEEFMKVQWTRLPHGVPSPQFVEQIKRLLTPTSRATAATMLEPGHPRPRAARDVGVAALGKTGKRVAVAALAVVALAVGIFFALRPPSAKSPPTPAASVATSASAPPAPLAAKPPLDLASAKSIAVLPFANMSDDKDANAFFADGIHEDILTSLSNIRELRVVSRTSVMQYRGTTKTIRQIAQEMGVAYVLEGSVRRAGNRIRVTGQLIRAATDEHVWARNYDRDLTDVFAIQAELAQAIAGELRAAISPQEKSLLARRPTENLPAYELVLKARAIRQLPGNRSGLAQQISLLNAAVQLDPKYADAYADLAYVHAYAAWVDRYGAPISDDLANAQKAIDAAIRLAPDSPDVIRALGDYHYYGERDYRGAMEQYEKMMRLRPNDSTVYNRMASVHRRQGRWAESVANFRRAKELDPADLANVGGLAVTLSAGRRYAEAIAEWRVEAEQIPNNLRFGYAIAFNSFCASGSTREMDEFIGRLSPEQANSSLSVALRRQWAARHGDLEEAIRLDRDSAPRAGSAAIEMAVVFAVRGELEAAKARLGNLPVELRGQVVSGQSDAAVWMNLAKVEALLGNKTEALRCARKAVELTPEAGDAVLAQGIRADLTFVQAWTGDKDAAIAEYARLLRTPFGNSRGTDLDTGVHVMKRDPRYAPLRGDPRFEALLNDPKNNALLF